MSDSSIESDANHPDRQLRVGETRAGGPPEHADGEPVVFPLEEVLQGRTFICGKSGSGKSNTTGVLIEQGLLVGTVEYFSKSHVLKRIYEDEEHPFGWMQDGVFDLFETEGRLYRWRAEENLVDVAEELP